MHGSFNLALSDDRHASVPRSRRVLVLLLGVAVLGIGDLVATATHMHGVGIVEANPLARHLIVAESTEGLVLFKLGSIGLSIGLMARVRRHRAGEVGSWLLLVIMVGLTLYWHHYATMLDRELAYVVDYDEFARQMRLAAAAH